MTNYKATEFTSDDILTSIKTHYDDQRLMLVGNPSLFAVSTRLTAYRDTSRWSLVIEVLGCSDACGSGVQGITLCKYILGNTLIKTKYHMYLSERPLSDTVTGPLFDWQNDLNIPCLQKSAKNIVLRGLTIPLQLDEDDYIEAGIVPEFSSCIQPHEFARALAYQYQGALFTDEAVLRNYNASNLQMILRLYEWYHPDPIRDEKMCECETFRMIAEVLETGNQALYRPTMKPNTHWSHWPDAGAI